MINDKQKRLESKHTRTCAECGGKLTGCSCAWRKASDGKMVHRNCKEKYEQKLRGTYSEPDKLRCVYCKELFQDTPYFKTDAGDFIHFKCMAKYENELKRKIK